MADLEDFPLDIFAQNKSINRLYTAITLAFPFLRQSAVAQEELVRNLRDGLDKLAAALPWVAGKVIQLDGVFKIVSSETRIHMGVKILTGDTWPHSWDELQRSGYPFRMLKEDLVAPRPTVSNERELADGLPVFLVQVSFIPDGLLLTLQGQHGAMDMAGLVQVIRLFAQVCRGDNLEPEEVRVGNMNRARLVPLLSSAEFEEAQRTAEEERNRNALVMEQKPLALPEELTWAYFSFASTALTELKSLANQSVPRERSVSTDDVLSTFIWQAITRARLQHFQHSDDMPTTLSRNVDVRRALGIPADYPGLLVRSTDYTCSIKEVLEEPLGVIATKLRSILDPAVLRQSAELAATLISRGQAATSHGATNPALDVRLSSWAKERCYDIDFGFGKPEAVRRPAFTEGAREGLVYFLPKARNGDIVVGVCLRREVMGRLRNLVCTESYARYIG